MAGSSPNGLNVPERVIRMELISYFTLYPDTVTTCLEMAHRLDRDMEGVERQMEALVGLEILQKSGDGDRALYSYLPPLSRCMLARKHRQVEDVVTCGGSDASESDGGRNEGERGGKGLRRTMMPQ